VMATALLDAAASGRPVELPADGALPAHGDGELPAHGELGA
jgi:hypothetical protein